MELPSGVYRRFGHGYACQRRGAAHHGGGTADHLWLRIRSRFSSNTGALIMRKRFCGVYYYSMLIVRTPKK